MRFRSGDSSWIIGNLSAHPHDAGVEVIRPRGFSMNSRERVQAVLTGKTPDRVPVCLHNSHLAAAQAGISMAQYRQDPQAIAKAHLLALEMHCQDSLYLTIDTALLAEAMGAESEQCGNEPARVVAPAISEPRGSRSPESGRSRGRWPNPSLGGSNTNRRRTGGRGSCHSSGRRPGHF